MRICNSIRLLRITIIIQISYQIIEDVYFSPTTHEHHYRRNAIGWNDTNEKYASAMRCCGVQINYVCGGWVQWKLGCEFDTILNEMSTFILAIKPHSQRTCRIVRVMMRCMLSMMFVLIISRVFVNVHRCDVPVDWFPERAHCKRQTQVRQRCGQFIRTTSSDRTCFPSSMLPQNVGKYVAYHDIFSRPSDVAKLPQTYHLIHGGTVRPPECGEHFRAVAFVHAPVALPARYWHWNRRKCFEAYFCMTQLCVCCDLIRFAQYVLISIQLMHT